MRRLALLLALIAAAPAAALPIPIARTGFVLPSGNIVCNAGPYRGHPAIACTVFSLATSRGQKVWAMGALTRVAVGRVIGDPATDFPRLAYGRTWSWRGILCRSETTGLTCTNRAGHGFFLSRQSQRVF